MSRAVCARLQEIVISHQHRRAGSRRRVIARVFAVLAVAACVVTLISTLQSDLWWIRVLDFARLLELVAIVLVAIGCAVFLRRWRWPVLAALTLSAGWQVWRLWPYTPFAPEEVVSVAEAGGVRPGSCFSVLGLNVLQSNRNFAATIALIGREQPDVLLLMETDSRWRDALRPVLDHYPHRLLRPIDNTYGMIFASRLPVDDARMTDITDRDTPTLYARLRTRDGQGFDYVGLHPRPPLPGQDTGRRDAKIERAALAISDEDRPAVAMGDFNDVAWSRTTRLFKRTGGFLDPRIGRGDYASFPARYTLFGWPLDQLFVTPSFTFRRLRVLEDVGSDHRPLAADLCLRPGGRPAGNGVVQSGDSVRRQAKKAVREIR